MRLIDYYISNNNHHWQMARPVLKELQVRGYRVRLLSLCEFRRMPTPELPNEDIEVIRLFPFKTTGLSTSLGSRGLGDNRSAVRNLFRWALWIIFLRPQLVKDLHRRAAVAVVPNDVAYPFNYICRLLKK